MYIEGFKKKAEYYNKKNIDVTGTEVLHFDCKECGTRSSIIVQHENWKIVSFGTKENDEESIQRYEGSLCKKCYQGITTIVNSD